jgi:cytochrome c
MQLRALSAGILIFVVLIGQAPNHAPVIKIIQPAQNSIYLWNSQIAYSVEVSDAEDGESKYQEIQSAEVLVSLKYLENSMKAANYLKQKKFSDTTGLISMLVSNCFSCHGFKTKLAGPSFQDISKKYTNTISYINQLKKHIQKGSTGIWGKEVMPTHPELTDSATGKMVKWIFRYANDNGSNYFVGLQGSISLKKPTITGSQGVFVLTAFYADHGTIDFPNKRMTGSGQVIIQMK